MGRLTEVLNVGVMSSASSATKVEATLGNAGDTRGLS